MADINKASLCKWAASCFQPRTDKPGSDTVLSNLHTRIFPVYCLLNGFACLLALFVKNLTVAVRPLNLLHASIFSPVQEKWYVIVELQSHNGAHKCVHVTVWIALRAVYWRSSR